MITVKQIFERLDRIFPDDYKSFDCEFRKHRNDKKIRLEWTLHVSGRGICENFLDLEEMDRYIRAIEESLMRKNYNPKAVAEAVAEAEAFIQEHTSHEAV